MSDYIHISSLSCNYMLITWSITPPVTLLIAWIITCNHKSDYIHITTLSFNYMSNYMIYYIPCYTDDYMDHYIELHVRLHTHYNFVLLFLLKATVENQLEMFNCWESTRDVLRSHTLTPYCLLPCDIRVTSRLPMAVYQWFQLHSNYRIININVCNYSNYMINHTQLYGLKNHYTGITCM